MFAHKQSLDPRGSLNTLLSALFETLPEAMLLCDTSLSIMAANQAARDLLGTLISDWAGKRADEVLPSRDGIESPLHAGLEWRSTLKRLGKPYDIDVSGTPLQATNEDSEGWALVLKPLNPRHLPPEFLGSSSVTQELLEFVSRVARSSATSILLLGESGTGKDLIARRLHALSPRAAAPFVPVNCAALPESLYESELFGYEKGAFTGANLRKEGLFSFADGGTIFLDEIGELPIALQSKLLRVLEDHSFRPLGGTRSVSVNVRVVSATNVDLENRIQSGRFRSDLYYRLSGVQMHLPSLRERPQDIRELALHFLEHFNRVHHRHLRGIHPAAQHKLDSYAWPGNVRELRNAIERAVLMENDSWITPVSVTLNGQSPKSTKPGTVRESGARPTFCLRGSERELVAAALAEAEGNQTRAARLLGIGRFSLRYKMKKLGIL